MPMAPGAVISGLGYGGRKKSDFDSALWKSDFHNFQNFQNPLLVKLAKSDFANITSEVQPPYIISSEAGLQKLLQ